MHELKTYHPVYRVGSLRIWVWAHMAHSAQNCRQEQLVCGTEIENTRSGLRNVQPLSPNLNLQRISDFITGCQVGAHKVDCTIGIQFAGRDLAKRKVAWILHAGVVL